MQGQPLPVQARKLNTNDNNIIDCELTSNKKEARTLGELGIKTSKDDRKQKNEFIVNKLNRGDDLKTKKANKSNLHLKKELYLLRII